MPNVLMVSDNSLFAMLENLINSTWTGGGTLQVALFFAAHTPAHSDVLTDYTAIESPSFTGYSRAAIAGWSTSTPGSGTARATTSVSATFTPSGVLGSPVICYGYFIVASGGAFGDGLLWAQAWDAPFVFVDTTTTLAFQPVFNLIQP